MSNYKKTVWKDSPETEITAERLNNMEEGIETLDKEMETLNENVHEMNFDIEELKGKSVRIYSGENAFVGGVGWKGFSVVFPKPFTVVPFVSVMQTSLTSNENIALRGIDENGFTYEVYAPSNNFEYKSRWMVIGY